MSKSVRSILDEMIKAMPSGMKETKGLTFVMGNDMRNTLCKELNRVVRKYKGYKVVSYKMIKPDTAYLMPQPNMKDLN